MHISIIANSFQEDYIENLLQNLKDKVDRIDFIGSSSHEERNISDQVNFYNLRGSHRDGESVAKKIMRILRYYYRLISYLKSSNAKIIHTQYFRFPIFEGIFLTMFIRLLGKKAVYTAHDLLPRSKANQYNRVIFTIIYKLQNQIIVHTNYLRDRIITEFNIYASKVTVITHGVYQRQDNVSITRTSARQHLNLPSSSTIVLFFGMIAEYKGFDILLKSIKLIDNKYNLFVLVAGKVKIEYKKKFYDLIESTKATNLILHLKHIEDNEIEYFFKASNITVLPYKEASQSGVMLMSYAYGIPVIAPFLGGFPDDIIPGKTGYLFQPNSDCSLAQALIQYLSEWENTGIDKNKIIKDFAISNYSWGKSCSEMVEIYKNMI